MDKFGYYMVGDYKTYSKIDAITLHHTSGLHPTWMFNQEMFGQYNWTIEPSQTLSELYAQRATQIRERYDYIVLFYSGGADSQNMLNSFVDNNIHIDEIANFCALEGDGDRDSHFNWEIYNLAIPNVLKIIDQKPNIKHRVIDLTKLISELYNDPNIRFDFLYHMNSMFSPNNYARSFLREKIVDYQNIINSGKTLCFVFGSDKPRIFLENGRYCLKFIDLVDNIVSARTQQLNRTWEHDELFYWSPDAIDLLAKQAHVVNRFLKATTVPNQQDFDTVTNQKSLGSIAYQGTEYFLKPQALHRLIYDLPNTYVLKPSSAFFSERDTWFLRNPDHLISSQNYMQGIEHLKTIVPDYWLNGNFNKGLKGCVSPAYWLE